jgi:hypothetical protein
MWRCKQVANALAASKYRDLPLLRRLALRVHVALCFVCGKYHRQVMLMQDTAIQFRKHELSDPPGPEETLSTEARRRIAESLVRQK